MDAAELAVLLENLRRLRGEPAELEVKSAAGGLPKTAVESICSFANTNGGTLLLGIDEVRGFELVGLTDPVKARDDIVAAASDQLEPPIRVETCLIDLDGVTVVVVEVEPLPSDLRPCFVRSRGLATGALIRTGDGDRRMTQAEIGLAIANRSQPRYDAEPVPDASVRDLDEHALRRTLQRVRESSRALRDLDDESALRRLRVLVPAAEDGEKLVPSLGGLLTFGIFPQEFFPQLTISVVVHPARREADGPRFEDNPVIRGPIPDLISETLAALRRHMSVRGYISESGRSDELDYPMEAVREAVVNAVLHRDYSAVTRGTQIHVELHPDRLIVRSPGGLFGPVTVDDLGDEGVSSSRNAFLAQLLADAYLPRSERVVAENRASGIPTMIAELRDAGMPQPTFENGASVFTVGLGRSALLDPATRKWITDMREPGLSQLHHIALAIMKHGQPATNAGLRAYGADSLQATQILRDLVARDLAIRSGGRRYAHYSLPPEPHDRTQPDPLSNITDFGKRHGASNRETLANALRDRGPVRAGELAEATGFSRQTVLNHLNALIADGLVSANGPARSPHRSYRWVNSS